MSDDAPVDRAGKISRIWGGRFAAGPSAVMEAINVSIDFDVRLIEQDIAASKAHAAMLARQAIISQADAEAILAGLDRVLEEARGGRLPLRRALEDVHMNVESRLAELIGEPAGRLHTARSRNDQVATDFRLWVRDAIDALDAAHPGPAGGADRAGRGACRRRSCRASPTCRRRSR